MWLQVPVEGGVWPASRTQAESPATPPPFSEASKWPQECGAASGHPRPLTCPTIRQSRWATPLKAASGKDLPRGQLRGSRTPRHPVSCVLVCRTAQQGGGWAITHPAPEEGPESRWHRAGSQRPPPRTPGPSVPPLS